MKNDHQELKVDL